MDTVHEEALAAASLRPDGTIDINAAVRPLLEGPLNAVMDEQASELGVPRNGYRGRSPGTCVGRATLRIPTLREGELLRGRHRRVLLAHRHRPRVRGLRHVGRGRLDQESRRT